MREIYIFFTRHFARSVACSFHVLKIVIDLLFSWIQLGVLTDVHGVLDAQVLARCY